MQDLMKSFLVVRSTPGNFSKTCLQTELFVTDDRSAPFSKPVTACFSSSSCTGWTFHTMCTVSHCNIILWLVCLRICIQWNPWRRPGTQTYPSASTKNSQQPRPKLVPQEVGVPVPNLLPVCIYIRTVGAVISSSSSFSFGSSYSRDTKHNK